MASSTFIRSIILSMLVLISLCQAQKSASKPKALLLPVSKDPSTLLYITHHYIGTPSVPKTLVVDLGGRYTWIDCTNGYNSSTYKPGICGSAPCSLAKSSGACTRDKINICYLIPENTVTGNIDLFGEVAMDKISLQSTDRSKPGPLNSVPGFIFSCARDHKLVIDLARGAKGMLALGRNPVGLPTQLSSFFGGGFRQKFAICLPSKPKTNGVMFFGDSHYIFYPSYNKSKTVDVSSLFAYTKLYINPAFDEAIIPVWNVSKVKPFNDCYTEGRMGMTPLGIGVPDIAFVFENNVKWGIYGANSMDNLLQFDLAANKLAFTETLLWEAIECSNFKF
ncbi:hypothetical protein Dsin_029529 [Dipteronia sinensis]|uniref:Peptidase A1 domain-containing protein n=1 Tax=Dipteronia sinensis TaxID=43782 RepID=A0AAE0DVA5_9ROSI|nr:hypothetical protein Dsin_029529 [Dipteronia sinensis]